MTKIPLPEVQVDATSYIDPTGRLLTWNGEIYRAITAGRSEFFRSLIGSVRFRECVSGGLLVGTEQTEHSLEGFDLVLRHRRVTPRTYCVEWPPQMLRDAGVLTIQLCQEFLEDGLTLQDAYPWNVLFDGCNPVFVDIGSLVEIESKYLWKPYQQFCNFFLFPLYLCSAGLDHVARRLLYDYLEGIPPERCAALLPSGFARRNRQAYPRLILPMKTKKWTQRLKLEAKMKEMAEGMDQKMDMSGARRKFFSSLMRDVLSVKLPIAKTVWSDYQEWPEWEDSDGWTSKQRTLAELFDRLKPKTVVDVACNNGWYSILAAKHGARVVAFDQDASCVAKLYNEARRLDVTLTPLVVDVLNPPPAFGWRLCQFPSALDRIQGDMVIALALIHHLVITQWQNFERVVSLLDQITGRWLLLEFVPLSDEKSQIILSDRESFDWYTVENLAAVMEKTFDTVEVFDSHPEGRQLLLGSKGRLDG